MYGLGQKEITRLGIAVKGFLFYAAVQKRGHVCPDTATGQQDNQERAICFVP